jgi:hypothetical protein
MFGRGLNFALLLALAVLFLSIGVDIRAVLSTRPPFHATISATTAFPLPGPRRYPPGYHETKIRAAGFAVPKNPSLGPAGHQTIIKN